MSARLRTTTGTVEQTFRTAKHLFSTRPIFHKSGETIRGHVLYSFLALVLKKALEDLIAALGRVSSWPEIIADLNSLTEAEVEQDGKRFIIRSAPRAAASLVRAAGVALPPTVRQATDLRPLENVVPSRLRGLDWHEFSIS